MSESILSYDDYKLIITELDSTYKGVCQELPFEDKSDSIGHLASQFVLSIQNNLLAKKEKEKKISKILQYQQEVWEKQDLLEAYLTEELGYSCYSDRILGSRVNCRHAVSPEYREAFEENRDGNFPSWAVVRIF